MTRRARRSRPAEGTSPARLLEWAALACILAVMVARVFVPEMPFRRAQVVFRFGSPAGLKRPMVELIRLTFNIILLGAVSLWALGQVWRRRFRVGAPALGVLLVLFAAVSFASTTGAVDRRGAVHGWLEQVAILLAAFVMIQLARQRRRWALVAVVLAAIGVSMAFKGLAQVGWEESEHIASFQANPERALRQMGMEPGTPKARMFELRMLDRTVTGYFGLANMLASLLIILTAAAAGLALEKLIAAWRANTSGTDQPGGTRLPLAAAVAAVLLTVGCVATMILPRSKGASGSAVRAAAIAAAVLARPAFFARYRRGLLIACAGVLLAAIAGVWAYGTAHHGLPTASMQVRWEYWHGAVHVIGESPLRGAGPANFGDAYLKYRPLGAGEGTKPAHTALADAACAFGVPAAALYVAILIWVFLATTRPAAAENLGDQPGGNGRTSVRWCIFLTLAVFATAMAWWEPSKVTIVLTQAVLPAAVFALGMLAVLWAGPNLDAVALCEARVRIALGAGLAGFLVHNLVTHTLFTPGTATVFWITAAAGAAPAVRPRELPGARRLAIAAAAVIVAGTIAAGARVWRPVRARSFYLRSANFAYGRRQLRPAVADLKAAVAADPLDAIPAGHLTNIFRSGAQSGHPTMRDSYAADAVKFAELAYERSPKALNALELARALDLRPEGRRRALEMGEIAVRMTPRSAEFRQPYGEMLYRAGRRDAAAEEVRQIRRIHYALPAESVVRLSKRELRALADLAERIRLARTPPAASQLKGSP